MHGGQVRRVVVALVLLAAAGSIWSLLDSREEHASKATHTGAAVPVDPAEAAPSLQGSRAEGRSVAGAESLIASPPSLQPLQDLRRRLGSADAESYPGVLREIERLGHAAAPLTEDLIRLLAHEDVQVCQASADALAAIGEPALAPLVAAVLREYARGAAGAHGSWAMAWGPYVLAKVGAPAVVPVAELLGHDDAYFWALQAIERLALLRVPLTSAIEVVLQRLREVNEPSRLTFVMHAVPRLGRDAARCVPLLVERLQDPRPQVQVEAVRTLGLIGPDASAALTELERLQLEVPEQAATTREALREAIARIRGER